MKFSTLALGAALVALPMLSTGANAGVQLVSNGDFATGNFSGWTLFTTTNGTLGPAPLPQVASFDVTGSGASTAAHFEVGQPGTLYEYNVQRGGGLRQSFTTTAAGTLDFSADIASTSTYNNGAGGLFTVFLNGVSLATYDFGSVTAGTTERATLNFSTAVGVGLQNLEILVTRPNTSFLVGQYIDNISAIETVAGVPEPSTWAMMLLGFVGIGVLYGRNKKRAAAAA